MKRIVTVLSILLVSVVARAQDQPERAFDPFKDRQFNFDVLNMIAIITVIYLLSNFILQIIRRSIDYRLKNRMLDRQTPENIVSQLVQPEKKDQRGNFLQWFCVMGGIAIGLTIVSLIPRFGLHSLAIMAFCTAGGFGAYYYFTRPLTR